MALPHCGVGVGQEGAGGPGEGRLQGGDQVEQAPGDDDVVVAAHDGGHHTAAIPNTGQAGVHLGQVSYSLINVLIN